MKKLATLLAGAALVLMTTASAMAQPITGSIGFGGLLAGYTPAGSTVGTADGIAFNTATSFIFGTTGAYAPIPAGSLVDFEDFTFDPFSPPVNNLWSVTAGSWVYSFDLLSIAINTQNPTGLLLNGTGTLKVTGTGSDYDPTLGTWSFSGQSGVMTFSASSAPVPEPGTMMLLGAGFLGLAIYGKRRKNA